MNPVFVFPLDVERFSNGGPAWLATARGRVKTPHLIFMRIAIAHNVDNTIPAIHEPAHTRTSEVKACTDGSQPCFLSWAS